jgi:hypothetical protein
MTIEGVQMTAFGFALVRRALASVATVGSMVVEGSVPLVV